MQKNFTLSVLNIIQPKNGPKYPLKLGKDQYFLLGDSIDGVSDSRDYGVVDKSQILGSLMILLRSKRF